MSRLFICYFLFLVLYFCSKETFCQRSFIPEICNDGIDNDQDGLIDLFDDDCLCERGAYQAQCSSPCNSITSIASDIELKVKWRSDVFSRNRFNTSNNIIVTNNYIVTDYHDYISRPNSIIHGLAFFDKFQGNLNMKAAIDTFRSPVWYGIVGLNDNFEKVITLGRNNLISSYNPNNGFYNFFRSYVGDSIFEKRNINAADFNQDGIPEVYFGSTIVNSRSGQPLVVLNNNAGCNIPDFFSSCGRGASTIAGDFTDNPGLELACGNVLYEIQINNLSDTTGNSITKIEAPIEVGNGFTSMADFDGDGHLDILVVKGDDEIQGGGGIWIWNPRTRTLMAKHLGSPFIGLDGGLASIGDLDNNCLLDIVVPYTEKMFVFEYDNSSELILKTVLPTSDKSGRTKATLFDLNGDQSLEIIYRDQTYLRIIDGLSFKTIDSIECNSRTVHESPIVADVNNDGAANIIIHGWMGEEDSIRMWCFESASAPWQPARHIWNQHSYHVTNVNDDGTIPQYQQSTTVSFPTDSCDQLTCPQVYNNFGVQATYRTQQGCIARPSIDKDFEIRVSAVCRSDSSHITFVIGGIDTIDFLDSICLSSFYKDADVYNELLPPIVVLNDSIQIILPFMSDSDSLFFVLNGAKSFPPSFDSSSVRECIYSNNIDSIVVNRNQQILDLGPPQIKCPNDTVQLIASGQFISYIWQDQSIDSILEVTQAGTYSLIAYDECGREYRDTVVVDELQEIFINDTIRICAGENYTVYDTTLTLSGSYVIDINKCDSILLLELEVDPTTPVYDTVHICDGDSILHGNLWIDQEGDYQHTFTSAIECDSIVNLSVFIDPTYNFFDTLFICPDDSVLVFGDWQSAERIYSDSLASRFNCDSIRNISIKHLDSYMLFDTVSICKGDSIEINDEWIKEAGEYPILLETKAGCDSLVNIRVELADTLFRKEDMTLCEGDSIFIGQNWISAPGIFPITYTSSAGCDSIIEYTIAVDSIVRAGDTLTLCEGDSLLVHGNWVYKGGLYIDTIYTSVCFNISSILVEVKPVITSSSQFILCPNDSIEINGVWYSAPGEYTFMATTSYGCDSTFTAEISAITMPPAPVVDFECGMSEVIATMNVDEDWNILWSNGDTESQTTYSQEEFGSVKLTTNTDCEVIYDFDVPDIPTLTQSPSINDTLVPIDAILDYNLGVNHAEWDIQWSTDLDISCDSCSVVKITANDEGVVSILLIHKSSDCELFTSFEVSIIKGRLVLPNIFSPNGDGVNDYWSFDISQYSTPKTLIYDRWGNLLYQNNDGKVIWDGRFNGIKVQPGVYVYVVSYIEDNSEIVLKGDLTLFR